ncbi:MAG: LPS assembly protein LptD [Neptuniibacter sp.]
MPFAKRSTYTLTLAVSAALISNYSSAESVQNNPSALWDCSISETGEWNCDAKDSLQPTAKSPVSLSGKAKKSATDKIVSPQEAVTVAPATAVGGVKVDSGLSHENKTETKAAVGSQENTSDTSTLESSATNTSASNTSDTSKNDINAGAVEAIQEAPQAPYDQQIIENNPYTRLDWVFDQSSTGLECSGHYVEPAFPQLGDENQENPPLHLEAANSSTVLGGLTQLEGGVIIRQGSRRLSALTAELDQVTNKARLEGDVKLREPGILLLGDNAQVDTVTNEAIFSNAEYVLHKERLRGSADRLIHLKDGRLRLEHSKYTYCPPNSDAWGLEADSVVLNRDEGFGTAEDAVLRVGGIPVLYTPYFSFPIDDQRRSGFLYPSISHSEDSGADISLPYYFNISPNMDDTLTPHFISKRGLLLENEFRYMDDWSINQLSAAYLSDDELTNKDRWLIGINHRGKVGGKWQSLIDYASVSDSKYFEDLSTDLEVHRQDHLDQIAGISYAEENWSLSLLAHDYKTLDGITPYQIMPRLTLAGAHSFENEINFSYLAELTHFDRDLKGLTGSDRIVGDRSHLRPSINYLWKQPWGYLKPELSIWSTSYSLDNQVAGQSSSPSITAPVLSLDSSLLFDRELNNGGIQTLEPRVFALYVPDEDHSGTPVFDSSEYTFDYNHLFRSNRFSGKDRLGDSQQISLGLTSRFFSDSGYEVANVSLGQAFYFADRKVQLDNLTAAETSNYSDIATLATWYITPDFKTYLDTIFDQNNYDVNSSTIGFKYHSDLDHAVDFRYRFTDQLREQTDLSFIWPLHANWTTMGRVLYDIKGNETEEASLGLEYESCCWKLSFAGRHWLDGTESDGSNKYDLGLFIQFTLKGLGSFGSGNNSFLNDIKGYEEREGYNED